MDQEAVAEAEIDKRLLLLQALILGVDFPQTHEMRRDADVLEYVSFNGSQSRTDTTKKM